MITGRQFSGALGFAKGNDVTMLDQDRYRGCLLGLAVGDALSFLAAQRRFRQEPATSVAHQRDEVLGTGRACPESILCDLPQGARSRRLSPPAIALLAAGSSGQWCFG